MESSSLATMDSPHNHLSDASPPFQIHLPPVTPGTVLPNLNLKHLVDSRALTYDGTVDENLVCPICRCPFVNPVLTGCDHVFCRSCILGSLSHSSLCPIDRLPLSDDTITKAPKMVFNQLDSLKVKCPCCSSRVSRSSLENHLEKYCLDAFVRCPGYIEGCPQMVKRLDSERECLHFLVDCPDCSEEVEQIEMKDHREKHCPERIMQCERCSLEILRCEETEHEDSCPEFIRPCKWAEYGCQYKAVRRQHVSHYDNCQFKVIGPLAASLKGEINQLEDKMLDLKVQNELQNRRIKFLETGSRMSPDRPLDLNDLSLANLSESGPPDSSDSGNDYLLSLLEAQQTRINQLTAELSDFQGKNTMMLFNETLPIKNELAELRSTQQVTCMHVRWLLRLRLQENQRRFGGGPGPGSSGGPDSGGFGSDLPLSRRLSDSTTRDVITKL